MGVLVAFWHHLVVTQCLTTEVRKRACGPTKPKTLVCYRLLLAAALASTTLQKETKVFL